MKKKWVVIRLEITTREFFSKSLLAYKLANMGFGVIVTNSLTERVDRFPKGAYIVNSIYKNNHDKLKGIKKYGNRIYVLDEESLVIRDEEEYLRRIPIENMVLVDKFFCTGLNHIKIMRKGIPSQVNKFVVTGNPRINFLHKMFDEIESSKVDEIIAEHGDFVLLVSNFGTVNLFGSKTDKIDRYNKKYKTFAQQGLLEGINSKQEFDERFSHYEEIFQSFLLLIERLGGEYKNIKIIIRPHPAEDHKIWNTLASKYQNIHVIHDGNLTEWIKASRLVIQNGCTSAIESLFLNKPCISYRPVVNESYDQLLPSEVSVNFFEEQSVIDEIATALNSGENIYSTKRDGFLKIIDEYISHYECDKSVVRIIEAMDFKLQSCEFNSVLYNLRGFGFDGLYWKYKGVKRRAGVLTHKMLGFLGLKNNYFYKKIDDRVNILKHSKNKMAGLSVVDFHKAFDDYNKIYKINCCLKVRLIDNFTYVIEFDESPV